MEEVAHFLFFQGHVSGYFLFPIFLKMVHLFPPKLVDIFLRLDLNHPDLVPLLCLGRQFFKALLLDDIFMMLSLSLDLPEESMVGLPHLVTTTPNIVSTVDSNIFEDFAIITRFSLDLLVMFF